MELFTLGADRGAYTETDVRELARALTGWRADWSDGDGLQNFRFVPARWDSGSKTVFGRTGTFNWQDACRLVVEHPLHASFFVEQALELLHPGAAVRGRRAELERLYVERPPDPPGARGDPVLARAPRGPAHGQAAGRARGGPAARARQRRSPASTGSGCATRRPAPLLPARTSAGWDDKRWLDTNTIRARWEIVN